MTLPISITFKVFAIGSQLFVRDSEQNLMMFVKQKVFKLKENVQVFADENRTTLLYTIAADRVLDFNANYHVTNASGEPICVVNREGFKSLWKATFSVATSSGQHFTISEANPFAKVMDGLFGEIPILGVFSGYVFHPYYNVTTSDGTVVLVLRKRRAFLEGKYMVEQPPNGKPLSEHDLTSCLLSAIMMVLLERARG